MSDMETSNPEIEATPVGYMSPVTQTVPETVPEMVPEMVPDTEVSTVEEDSKKGNIEATDTPVESEEEEEDEKSKTENKVHYIQPVVIRRDEGLPFPIVCSASLLAFVYLLKLFFMFCAFTRMGCNRDCVCCNV